MIVILDKVRSILRLDFWIIGILITLKIIHLNNITEETFPIALTILFSALYLGIFFSVVDLLPRKIGRFILFSGYALISILLFVDSVYFLHFGNLTSFFLVRQFSQVGDVTGSISHLVGFENLLMVLDVIPAIAILMVLERRFNPKQGHMFRFSHSRESLKSKLAPVSIFTALTVLASLSINSSHLLLNTLQQEYFTYHISDVTGYMTLNIGDLNLEDDVIAKVEDNAYADSDHENSHYYGIASDMNLVNIQLESFQNFLINLEYNGQEVTPNLNALLKEDTIYFDDFFQQVGRGGTSDSEFSMNNSIFPSIDGPTYGFYGDNTYYGLPWILKSEGYKTFAFHGYEKTFWNRDEVYPYQGIDNFISLEDYNPTKNIGWGLGDEEFFEQSVPYQEDIDGKFYAMMMTLTSHHPYDNLPTDELDFELKPEHEDTIFGNYLLAAHYVDRSFGLYIELLKESGLYENTMITLYGDHFGITRSDEESAEFISTEVLGKGIDYDLDHMTNTPFIVHIPGSGLAETISHTGSNVDFMPTVLHLLGIRDPLNIAFGKNLLFESNIVPERSFSPQGSSFVTEDVLFDMSKAAMFETGRVIDRHTREELNAEDYRDEYDKIMMQFKISDYILRHDYIKTIMDDKGAK